jgi:hypothetical protein
VLGSIIIYDEVRTGQEMEKGNLNSTLRIYLGFSYIIRLVITCERSRVLLHSAS